MKVIAGVLIFALFAIPARSQTETQKARYQKLLNISNSVAVQAKRMCKTDECKAQADALSKVLADGQGRLNNHEMVGDVRTKFSTDFETNMNALLLQLRKQQSGKVDPTAAKYEDQIHTLLAKQKEGCRAPLFKSVESQAECNQLCDDVLEQLVEICGLYAFVSPEAAIICIGAAAIGYGSCLNKCGQQCEGLSYPGATGNPCG